MGSILYQLAIGCPSPRTICWELVSSPFQTSKSQTRNLHLQLVTMKNPPPSRAPPTHFFLHRRTHGPSSQRKPVPPENEWYKRSQRSTSSTSGWPCVFFGYRRLRLWLVLRKGSLMSYSVTYLLLLGSVSASGTNLPKSPPKKKVRASRNLSFSPVLPAVGSPVLPGMGAIQQTHSFYSWLQCLLL